MWQQTCLHICLYLVDIALNSVARSDGLWFRLKLHQTLPNYIIDLNLQQFSFIIMILFHLYMHKPAMNGTLNHH